MKPKPIVNQDILDFVGSSIPILEWRRDVHPTDFALEAAYRQGMFDLFQKLQSIKRSQDNGI